MYRKECKWCNKMIEVEKQPHFASHVSSCELNPKLEERKQKASERFKGVQKVDRITLKKECPKCSIEFEVTTTESEIRRNKVKNYCSRECANSKKHSEETKQKISKSIQLAIEEGRVEIPENKRIKKVLQFECKLCGKKIIEEKYKKDRKYHKECWLKVCGGPQQGSSRGKCGWYKGFWCDSSYELAFLVYCLENKIDIRRNRKGYDYVYENENHKFYPDFIVDGEFVEIKNFRSELTDAKINHFPYDIKVYYKDTITPFLNYVKDIYGKNFTNLYEDVDILKNISD